MPNFKRKRTPGFKTGRKHVRAIRQKKRRRSSPRVTITRGVSLVPDRYMCKLRYVSVEPTRLGGAAQNAIDFSGNSAYDPDVTGVGHQPNGFDQFTALYDKYRVMGSSIKIWFVANESTVAAANCVVSVAPSTSAGVGTSINLLAEQARAKVKVMGSYQGRGQIAFLKHYMSTRKLMGISKAKAADDDYSGTCGNLGSGSSPAQQWYWLVSRTSMDESTVGHVEALVKITYYVAFWQRKEVNLS